jgi:ABC-type spermidine/putrescine transport system permease subunit II
MVALLSARTARLAVTRMSYAAKSVRSFAIYLGVLGPALVVAPNVILSTFGFGETREVWIRVLGVVVFNLGVYYWFAAASDARPFFRATVATRVLVIVAFTVLVVTGLAHPMLIVFGAMDFAGGLWTAWALARDSADAAGPARHGREG